MSKYKVGDKVVFTVTGMNERGQYPKYILNYNFYLWKQGIDKCAEPLSTYTEPLEAKIRRQAAEITRLLEENKELKEESKRNYTINIEMARAEGQNEAWELARKIYLSEEEGGYDGTELFEIFNEVGLSDIYRLSYPEAVAKVAEWEKANEEIKVGDIYKNECGNCFVICDVNEEDNKAQILWSSSLSSRKTLDEITRYYTKTGRHIDIDSFLKQIGGGDDEK